MLRRAGESARRAKTWARQRSTTILVFAYGIVVGTSAPILAARCSSGGCGNCGGFCAVTLGVLPLLIFVALSSRVRKAASRLFAHLSRRVRRQNV